MDFSTFKALCTFNTIKKTRGLYLIWEKSCDASKASYGAEKHAIYNTPTVHYFDQKDCTARFAQGTYKFIGFKYMVTVIKCYV